MFNVLDFMYHFTCSESNYTKILKCFIVLCLRLQDICLKIENFNELQPP